MDTFSMADKCIENGNHITHLPCSQKETQLNTSNFSFHQVKTPGNSTSLASQLDQNNGICLEVICQNNEKAQNTDLTPQEKRENPATKDSERGSCRQYAGILLALFSGLISMIGGVIVKYLKSYHAFTLAVFRFQGILIPGLCMVLYAYYVQKIPVFKTVWPLTDKENRKKCLGLLLHSMFGTTALLLYYFAFKKMDLADVIAISSCQPVLVTIAAYVILREPCGIFPMLTALLTVVGVGVIVRPPILTGNESFDQDTLIGAGFTLAGTLNATMIFVIVRYLKDAHVSLISFTFGIWGTIQCGICALYFGVFTLPQTTEHWLLALALAGTTLTAKVAMTLALQCEQAGSIAVVRTSDCLFAFLMQFVLLNVIPDVFSVAGASIIVFCVLITTFRKWISTLPITHPTRRRFWFVMK